MSGPNTFASRRFRWPAHSCGRRWTGCIRTGKRHPNWTLLTERQSFLVFLTGAVLLIVCLLLLSAIKAYGVSRIGAEVLTPQRYLKLGAAALFQNLHQGSEY